MTVNEPGLYRLIFQSRKDEFEILELPNVGQALSRLQDDEKQRVRENNIIIFDVIRRGNPDDFR